MTFQGPFLPKLFCDFVISALVFLPGVISLLALGKPGLGASDLSWDGQTGQGGLVTMPGGLWMQQSASSSEHQHAGFAAPGTVPWL